MHSRIRAYGVTLAALLALAVALPVGLAARPKPGVTAAGGFRLFGRSLGAATVNRVYCGLLSSGKVCADSTNSSTIPGGFWPKGTGNQYVFNSGMQFGGVVSSTDPNFAWNNDTTGAFFFDARGDLSHGQEVQPIFNHSNPADAASWPTAANVPYQDRSSSLYQGLLQGRVVNGQFQPNQQVSQGDIWFLTWDGDPAFNAGRKHPLGVLVETRMMGWNYPAGNNDILYLIYTFYNISSTCDSSYAGVRPSMKAILEQQAAIFQAKNNAAFGVTIPACGYSIKRFYANFAADMDVTPDAGKNYASVNIPFKLGYIYSSYFSQNTSQTGYPADITGAPFMGGYGFVGVKYLASPDSAPGKPAGLSLFSDTENGGVFGDPGNAIQLYRYMSGTVTPALGDGQCNHDPVTTHICHVEVSQPQDMRFFQSSGPFDLPPGASGSVAVAYIFASPVKYGPCQTPASGAGVGTCGNLNPGNPEKLLSVSGLAAGDVNTVDHLTGFESYQAGAETAPTEDHFVVTQGSLLGKANLAQLVFSLKFLLPFAPDAPDFFLVPGDNQVAVMWRKSTTEASGDLFYSVAHSPVTLDSLGNPTAIPNPLYDPNYRFLDVEGYRVYRGRNQGDLHLLAQFDYAGTTIADRTGQINPVPTCAPELGVSTGPLGADSTCGGVFDHAPPGVADTDSVAYAITSPLVQVVLHSGRVALADGTALVTVADTAVTGTASGKFPDLKDTGVPFTYVDHTALNNLRYFYAVTAFDVNSIQSGPSSLESPRNPKAVTPMHPASNWDNTGSLSIHVVGRGVPMDSVISTDPTLDASTGTFSGPARPATGASLAFVGALVKQVVTQSGSMSVTLDSMQLGASYFGGAGGGGTPNTYFLSISSAIGTVHSAVAVTQDQADVEQDVSGNIDGGPINSTMAAKFGGNASYHLAAAYALKFPGAYFTGLYGRGCINSAAGFTTSACAYNGARWFDGPSPAQNETYPHPNRGDTVVTTGPWYTTTRSNAGSLTGVATIYEPEAYSTITSGYRDIEGAITGAGTAADYNVYWGATAGTIDSVVDITHNVLVPFDTTVIHGYTWGIMDTSVSSAAGSFDNRPGVATMGDFGCVTGFFGNVNGRMPCTAATRYRLTNTVHLSPVALMSGASIGSVQSAATLPHPGFLMYMPGHVFTFALTGAAPSKPAVWTLRTYTGGISGGGGTVGVAGNYGAYKFTPQPSPLTAVGASVQASYQVTNRIIATTSASLDAVHTVPDPYYVTNGYEVSPTSKDIKFVNLPKQCSIRIYSTSGVLVRIIDHNTSQYGGDEDWDVRNRNNQVVASGVYFYSIESATGPRVVKRLTIVNFSQ